MTQVQTFLVGPSREFRNEYPVSRVKTMRSLAGMVSGRSWSSLGVVSIRGTPAQARALLQTKRLLVAPTF